MLVICAGICTQGYEFAGTTLTSLPRERPRPESRDEQIKRQFSVWDGSHLGLTKYIKGSMNDPDSYEHDQTTYQDNGDHLIVHVRFRGKNAFGGVVRSSLVAKVDLQGNVLQVISQEP